MGIHFSDKYKIIGFYVLITMILFWRNLISGGNFIFGDGIEIPYSEMHLAAQELKNGRILLWNPLLMAGHPSLAGGHAGLFYPFWFILFYLFPAHLAYNISLFIHVVLAGIFTKYYAKSLNVSRYSSIFAGIVFMFSSFLVSHLQNLARIQAFIWLPLTFMLIDQLIKSHKKCKLSFYLAFIFAFQLLSGHQPTAFYAILCSVIYFIIRIAKEQPKQHQADAVKSVIFMFLSLALGACLSAIQSFPTFELLIHSSRSQGLSMNDIADNSYNFKNILTVIFPFLFDGWSNFDNQTRTYFGIIPLICFCYALSRRTKIIEIHVWLLLISMFLALGQYNPLFSGVLKILPIINFLGRPYRFLLLLSLAFAIISALGLDCFLNDCQNNKKEAFSRTLKLLSVLLLSIFSAIFAYKNNIKMHNILGLDGVIRIIVIIMFFSLVIISLNYKLNKLQISAFLITFVLLDLFSFSFRQLGLYEFHENDQRYADYSPPILRILDSDQGYYRIASFRSRNEPGVNLLAITNNLRYGYPSVDKKASLIIKWFDEYFYFSPEKLKLFGVKYILSDTQLNDPNYDLIYDKEIKLYKLTMYLPRIETKSLSSKNKDVGKILNSDNFSVDDYAILKPELKEQRPLITYEDSNQINIEAFGPGVLLLRDTFYPGWKAYNNGVETKINRAEKVFRAIVLREGKQHVEFHFKPISFYSGLIVSLAALIFIITSLLVLKR